MTLLSEKVSKQLPYFHHSAAVSQRNQLSVLRDSYRLDARHVRSKGAWFWRVGGNNADNAVAIGDHKAIARWSSGIHNARAQVRQRKRFSFAVASREESSA